MDSNKDMQNMRDLFDFHTGQQIQTPQEACSNLVQEMRAPGVVSGEPIFPLPAPAYDPNDTYCRGYLDEYLDGIRSIIEEEVKDGLK